MWHIIWRKVDRIGLSQDVDLQIPNKIDFLFLLIEKKQNGNCVTQNKFCSVFFVPHLGFASFVSLDVIAFLFPSIPKNSTEIMDWKRKQKTKTKTALFSRSSWNEPWNFTTCKISYALFFLITLGWTGEAIAQIFPRRKQRWQPFCSRRLFLKRNQSHSFGINCRWRRRKSHSFGNSHVMQGRAQNHKSYKKKQKKNRQKENQKMSKSKINSHQSNWWIVQSDGCNGCRCHRSRKPMQRDQTWHLVWIFGNKLTWDHHEWSYFTARTTCDIFCLAVCSEILCVFLSFKTCALTPWGWQTLAWKGARRWHVYIPETNMRPSLVIVAIIIIIIIIFRSSSIITVLARI